MTPTQQSNPQQPSRQGATSPWTMPFRTSFDNQQQDQASKPAQTPNHSQAAATRDAFANSYSCSPNR